MRNRFPRILILPQLLLYIPFVLLFIPLPWVLAAIASIVLHELCHIVATILLGKRIFLITIGSSGASIQTDNMNKKEELLISLAGPASCFITLLLARYFPRVAVCSVVHSLYNLLPLYPLDGGRVLHCIAALLLPFQAAMRVSEITERVCMFLIVVIFVCAVIFLRVGILPILAALVFAIRQYNRKKSCKESQLRVQ